MDALIAPGAAVANRPMTFVTTLTLQSGDRAALDDVVDDIAAFVERKGAELRGPHPRSPETLRVPQYKRLAEGGGEFDAWSYTVYTRTMEIVGHDAVARRVAGWSFPTGVHVEAEVERIRPMGSGNG